MVAGFIAVAVGGVIVWLLLRWAEKEASDRETTSAFFKIAKIVLVVLVFGVEFFLLTVLPQTSQQVIQEKYRPPPYRPPPYQRPSPYGPYGGER